MYVAIYRWLFCVAEFGVNLSPDMLPIFLQITGETFVGIW